jgi:hypothetical protein
MKATMKRRVEKLEAAGKGGRAMFVIEAHHEKPHEQAIAEAGVEPEPGDITVLLLDFDDASRDMPAVLRSAPGAAG